MSSTTINNPEPSANTLSHQKVSRLTSTALFAALICVTTAYIFHIPFGVNGGYVHIGDSLIYLAAAFLPTPYAMFAGAIGGAMADILTAPVYAPATFIIGVIVAAVISFIGYYITDVILFGTWGALIPSIVGTLAQSGGSAVIFIILGSTLDKAGFKSTMKNKFGI